MVDLLIIGAGASGTFAALAARQAGMTSGSIVIIEKEDQPLRKVLASGNGRCNLLNTQATEGRLHGADPAFAQEVIRQSTAQSLIDRFEKLGLITLQEEEGRVYPRSMQSRSVSMILLRALEEHKVTVECSTAAIGMEKTGNRFRITCQDGSVLTAKAVVVAAGSCATPDLGGTRLGYDLLASLGHKVSEPRPALVPLTLSPHPLFKYAKGVRFRGCASFESTGTALARSCGEFLITSYGLSGIAAMELGRTVAVSCAKTTAEKHEKAGRLVIDFLPELDLETVADILDRKDALNRDPRSVLAGLIPDKIGQSILTRFKDKQGFEFFDDLAVLRLAQMIKGLTLDVTGTRDFEFAHIASGGVVTDCFDASSMMSKRIGGLFACGEVLDVDGDTGGFNLLWAFSSGYRAGQSAAKYLSVRQD
ncbi:MAG TPA: aminoacetone oxidase family FAD-binding enzyme [Clostridia bacterium]|nr:aminoacetone oxidase family FAD-binding enzyme [Clostridia bacterium]